MDYKWRIAWVVFAVLIIVIAVIALSGAVSDLCPCPNPN